MKYGFFNDIKKEYVITRPDTPLPWINYLGCENYFGIISNTAGGYSFYKDARYRRIIRYRYNNVPIDFGGRYLYIRDNDDHEFWSPTWQPIRKNLDQYTCRHGLGYTIINSIYHKIETQIKYFVPLGEDIEIWYLKIKNYHDKPVNLSIFSLVEFCLWDAFDDATNFQRNLNISELEIEGSTIYHKTGYRERRNHFSSFSCSTLIEGFDTQRENFLGPYRSWDNPLVVESGRSCNSRASGGAPIGSHHIKFTLKANETKEIIFILGYHENNSSEKFDPPDSQIINKKIANETIKKYLNVDNVKKAFKELKQYWENILRKFNVNCPDVHTNRMVNIWNPYQCMVTFNMSRSASYFESGISRGIGFRDSNQDLLGFIHLDPERARSRILELASTQLENGGVYHQYQPLTKKGNNDIGDGFNDDPLWLVLSVSTYLKETGDLSLLDEQVPYDNKLGTEQPLIEHLEKCLLYIQKRFGSHQLPLIGRADWNDCLNLNSFSMEPNESFQNSSIKEDNLAESIFIAALYILAAKELAEIFEILGLNDVAKKYVKNADKMNLAICKFGWDGEWFLRAYDQLGSKIGSRECKEGKIFIEPQGFCIMAGVGINNGLAKKALKSVRKHLATPHGIMLLSPTYSKYYLNLGEITSYPPGYKENGSVFCHPNPWVIIAEAIMGNGDNAHDYYLRINPSAREKISDIHRCEPYVYSQMISGKDAPNFGEAKNSWLTGTAAWNYIAITNWILGIRPTHTGLMISPMIPKDWPNFTVSREFRGVIYLIKVERIAKGNYAILYVNDQKLNGNIIPYPKSGTKKLIIKVEISNDPNEIVKMTP